MKRVFFTVVMIGCSAASEDPSVGEDDLTSMTGTYVVDSRPWFGGHYAQRITFAENATHETELVTSSGTTQIVAGRFELLPSHTLALLDDTGGGPLYFEYERTSNDGLRLYGSARQYSFTMKRDPTYRPAPTSTKVIACTGPTVDAKLTLDRAQNRRGSLVITRRADADPHDPPSVTVNVTKNEDGAVPEYVYFEGSSGEQDYYVNMKKPDFERGSGNVELNLRWAEGGQEWSVGVSCRFE
jgi:hypothetical protein